MRRISLAVTICTLLGLAVPTQAKDYYATDFGAKADGVTLNTRIIQRAIDYVNAQGGGTLVFTPGSFVTGTIHMKSNVTLHLQSGATLLGSTNPFDYEKNKGMGWQTLINAMQQENIGITGEGTVNCRGFVVANNLVKYIHRGLVDDKLGNDRPHESQRPMNILFRECKNVVVKGITLRDPASWNQTYDQCENLLVENVKADCKSYWNNDGVDLVDCKNVVVRGCYFDAADDVFCLKSHSGKHSCENILIENCTGRSSANGVKFGTASRGGFKNITIRNLTIFDTYRSAITFATVDGAFIDSIFVDGLRSYHTGNVIFLRQGRRSTNGNTPYMRNIVIKNVYAEVPFDKPDAGYNYEGPVEDMPRNISPASIVGVPGFPIQNVLLQNIEIVYPGRGNANFAYRGTTAKELDAIPEMEKSYPEFSQFKELPAWALYMRHAEGITLDNVKFTAQQKDYRPALVTDDVKNLTLKNVEYSEPDSKEKSQEVFYKTTNVKKEK